MAQGPLLSESQLGLACLKIKILKVVPKLLNLILLDWYLGTCISIIISANTPPEDCLINRFIRWWFNLSSTLDTSLWRIAHAQAACNYTGISGGVAQASVVVKLPSDSNAQPRMRNSTQSFPSTSRFLSNTRMLNLQTNWYIVLMNTGIWSPVIPKVL